MILKILGLRNLKSKGIFPIKRAYVKIDLNMLKNRGEEKRKKRIYKTLPKESGPNPNICTVIEFVFFISFFIFQNPR